MPIIPFSDAIIAKLEAISSTPLFPPVWLDEAPVKEGEEILPICIVRDGGVKQYKYATGSPKPVGAFHEIEVELFAVESESGLLNEYAELVKEALSITGINVQKGATVRPVILRRMPGSEKKKLAGGRDKHGRRVYSVWFGYVGQYNPFN